MAKSVCKREKKKKNTPKTRGARQMTREEIIACLQALSRVEGATFAEQFKNKNTFISENIDYIAEKLIQLLKGLDK